MTGTMRAARFHADTGTNVLEDVPIPSPGPGEVLVKVAFCGICHSDLSLLDGTFPALLPVVTQGHEAAGTIAALGDGVTGWAVGDRVVPAAGRPCLQCRFCRRGDLTNCPNIQLMAFAYDGAWAEYTVAQAGGLTRVPDNVPLEQAAILADAVSTPFGAVVRTGQVAVGEAVGVWGVGGVGTHIVEPPGWSAPCRSSRSTSTPRCGSGPSNSAPTTCSIPATRTWSGRSPRRRAGRCSTWPSTLRA